MRISTSAIYDQQATAISNLQSSQADFAFQLSTGKKLNVPSDDPTRISSDLALHTQINTTTTSVTNVQNSISELTTVESTLGSATAVIQKARELAIQASSDTITLAQRSSIANQVDALLQQSVALANAQYAGKYVFAGTSPTALAPVTTVGSPISAVKFSGNFQGQQQLQADGEQTQMATSLKEAFNTQSSDGSLDIFQTLINLRNALTATGNTTLGSNGQTVTGTVLDQSASGLNAAGKLIDPTDSLQTDAAAGKFATPLRLDSLGQISFSIDGANGTAQINLNPATASFDNPPKAPATTSVVAAINAQTAITGVTAVFDSKTQRLTLSASTPFTIQDGSSPGATGGSNFSQVIGVTQQADLVNNLSRQLGDIDKILSVNLSARAVVGTRLQTLESLKGQFNKSITDNISTQSQIEDADIPATYSQYAQAQTALQAAYATTTRLESKSLFDYL